MTESKKSCFIIMPITTPPFLYEQYRDDQDHFKHVLEHLFLPAVEAAGFEPIPPSASGSDLIHAEIVKNLADADLVLCDMSILNPNVFFELGIRTALNRPVALVVDDLHEKQIPFDTGPVHFQIYNSGLNPWETEKDKEAITVHLKNTYIKNKDHNVIWKYFGVAQPGSFKPEDTTLGDKIDLISAKLKSIESKIGKKDGDSSDKSRLVPIIVEAIAKGWDSERIVNHLLERQYQTDEDVKRLGGLRIRPTIREQASVSYRKEKSEEK